MASDLSNIIKEDISNTLESLLSSPASITDVENATVSDVEDQQCICIDVDYEFSNFETVKLKFYIPTKAATKFEFLMLGGATDLKEVIDDEILDAVNEIVSNICGSISTNVNAQGFDDLGSLKFTITNKEILSCSGQSVENLYKFDISLGDDNIIIFIEFASSFIPYLPMLTSDTSSYNNVDNDESELTDDLNSANSLLSLIGDDSVDNLKLLFDVKLKLSVRLGSKVVLLKDIMGWDTGTIIELEQMVNQPLDILVNGITIGTGEAVIVEGKFGIKIKNIGEKRLI